MPYEDDARAQIARQTLLRAKTPLCAMNFAPFEAQLATLSEARKSWLDGVLRSESVAGLLRLLASESLTSVELVLACVQRIKQFSWLRAVVALNPHALELARSADKARVAPLRGSPLRGIPVLLKDNIGTGDGMPNTAGAAALQNVACDRDAFLVQRIRAAGGIPIGKTNLSEWANFFADSERGKPPNGFSAMGGQTRNPYGGFDVGGSSSGSASAVAAALVPVAVGTETHGSIIFPALRNSVCGLKPSLGLVSRDRIIPITDATDTAGPIARSMTDLCMLMDALTGFDARDPACVLTSLSAPLAHQQTFAACLRADGLAGVRVGVLHGSDGRAGSDTLLHAARGALLRAGA